MRSYLMSVVAAGLLVGTANPAEAESFSGADYPAKALLDICTEADNDARLLGAAAEVECEQYIIGFADALAEVGAAGPGTEMCPPAVNTADEIRWSFMRWVHESYTARTKMPAADALLATLKDKFPCS